MKFSAQFALAAVLGLAAPLFAQEIQPQRTEVGQVNAYVPQRRDATEERIAQLQAPEGFSINVFASGLGHARMIEVADDGTVYLTCPQQNRVMRLKDADGDGRAEVKQAALEGLDNVHGITIHEDTMYLAAPQTVWAVKMNEDGSLGQPRVIIDDLPPGGRHPNRTLGVGADNRLYITVGSTCNACVEEDPESAAILTAALDGGARTIFATGLRNTIGFGWHPRTGQMWGMDHGSDNRGDDIPPEELNHLQEGKDYGWPFVFGKRVIDPLMSAPPGAESPAQHAMRTEPSVLEYQAHSSPIGFVFYTGESFPERYRDGAFVIFRGSWNRRPPAGYKVAFVEFDEGRPKQFEDFITGFLIDDGRAHFARLAGIDQAADGSILFCDDTNGMMYRVAYQP